MAVAILTTCYSSEPAEAAEAEAFLLRLRERAFAAYVETRLLAFDALNRAKDVQLLGDGAMSQAQLAAQARKREERRRGCAVRRASIAGRRGSAAAADVGPAAPVYEFVDGKLRVVEGATAPMAMAARGGGAAANGAAAPAAAPPALNPLLEAHKDFLRASETTEHLLEAGVDGVFTFFAASGRTDGARPKAWPSIRAWAAANKLLFVPTVAPGFDDTKIKSWNRVWRRARAGTTYYKGMWQAASDANPDAVMINSYNDWPSGSQIEPALTAIEDGTYLAYSASGEYLDETRAQAAAFMERKRAITFRDEL